MSRYLGLELLILVATSLFVRLSLKITTYFSTKDDVQGVILDALGLAERQVNVAVAWFTDVDLFELQKRSVQKKVDLSTQ